MTKILIDTDVWVNLAKYAEQEKLLNTLEEFILRGEAELILPEIIFEEFKRNKIKAIKDSNVDNLRSSLKNIKSIAKEINDTERKETMMSYLNDLANSSPAIEANATQSIKRIESLHEKAEVIPMSDSIKLRAAQRGIEKVAPYHLNKNSIGDAIIIESYIEYIALNQSKDLNYIFVTKNHTDFSEKGGNRNNPHKELAYIFEPLNSHFFIDIQKALHHINPELVEESEYFHYHQDDLRSFTDILDASEEFFEKVWYNRCINRLIKPIPNLNQIKSAEELSTAIQTIIIPPAKKIEEKYGKENLQWNDFEWGMLNGKLSAIRWVLGDEWDNLDT